MAGSGKPAALHRLLCRKWNQVLHEHTPRMQKAALSRTEDLYERRSELPLSASLTSHDVFS